MKLLLAIDHDTLLYLIKVSLNLISNLLTLSKQTLNKSIAHLDFKRVFLLFLLHDQVIMPVLHFDADCVAVPLQLTYKLIVLFL